MAVSRGRLHLPLRPSLAEQAAAADGEAYQMLCPRERNAYFLYTFRARWARHSERFRGRNVLPTCNSPLKIAFFLLYFTLIRLGSRHATRALSAVFHSRTLSL
jgi:hypothetical protein